MGSGTTFRKLGVAVVATAFTALVGITAASAAGTTTTQGGAGTGGSMGTGAAAGGGMTKASTCESRADKRHLTGDQRDSYVKRCEAQVNTKHHKTTASKTSAKPASPTGTQGQGGAASTQ